MNKLIMWSGGIDSTYVLAKALSETDDKIFVHHINIVDRERRFLNENQAILQLIPKLINIRHFYYKETTSERMQMDLIYNMPLVCFEAGGAMRHWQGAGHKIDEWSIGTHMAEGHWQTRWDVIIHATKAAYWEDPKIAPGYEEPPPFKLHDLVSKKEEIRYLRDLYLYDSCWYCRTPKDNEPCNNCKTCIEVKESLC